MLKNKSELQQTNFQEIVSQLNLKELLEKVYEVLEVDWNDDCADASHFIRKLEFKFEKSSP